MLNAIHLMGRFTADPTLRRTGTGLAVASFTLAVERDYPDADGNRETDFIDIVAWRGTAEFVSKYFQKGQMATVVGRLQIRPWTDAQGNKRRSAEVVAEHVYFCGKAPQQAVDIAGENPDSPFARAERAMMNAAGHG